MPERRVLLLLLLLCLLLPACAAPAGPEAEPGDGGRWGGHELSGGLVYINSRPDGMSVERLDLVTGERRTLFTVPERGWLSSAAVSPDGNQLVLSYSPPPPEGEVQLGYNNLYLLLADGETAPQPLVDKQFPQEIYFNPVWSPDSRYLYYTHVVPNPEQISDYTILLERLDYLTRQAEVVAENAIWPALSPDGSRLAYVTVYPAEPANELIVSDADGDGAAVLVAADAFLAVDAPVFSPDGSQLYFSASSSAQPASLSWLDRLLGVQTAAAHDFPSDWWRIPAAGGEPERLTTMQAVGLYGAFAPDGAAFAFSSTAGLFAMNPDGSNVVQLGEALVARGLSWGP